MSMDELLLQELYGSQQVQAEQQIKQAQIELVEAVAAEAGVDLNELDDAELAKFAHYVLSDEDEPAGGVGNAYAEQTKLAEADLVGRQMAHSYADEMSRIQNGETMRYNTMSKVASAMSDVADAWHMQKEAENPQSKITYGRSPSSISAEKLQEHMAATSGDGPHPMSRLHQATFEPNAMSDAELQAYMSSKEPFGERMRRYGRAAGEFTGVMDVKGRSGLNRAGRLAGTAGALGALGYGGYRLATRNKDDMSAAEKVSMLKIASEGGDKLDEKFGERMKRYGRNVGEFTGILEHSKDKSGWKRGGRLAGTAGALGALGYGGYRLATRNKDHEAEKISMYLDAGYEAAAYAVAHSPEEFAKEAEFRAAEILLANGVDPATLEQVYPENVKIASFPTPDDAISYREAAILEEYNDMLNAAAMHIIENLD